jgi:hypothetical protein
MENFSESIVINATKNQIEEFKESILWQDIVRELESWKEGFTRDQSKIVNDSKLNNPSTASVLMHLGYIAGCVDTVNYLLNLPDTFLEILDERAKSKSEVSK